MKKFFLIPLLTLMCSVMAWGADVARIGDTNYTSFNNAFNAATDGQTIVLLANIGTASNATNEARTVSKNITIDGQGLYSVSRYFTVQANKTLTLKGVTVANEKAASSSLGTIYLNNGSVLVLSNAIIDPKVAKCISVRGVSGAAATIRLAEGTENTIKNYDGASSLYSYNASSSNRNGKITIEGTGSLNIPHTGTGYAFTGHSSYGGNFEINASNVTISAAASTNLINDSKVTLTFNEGADTYAKIQKNTKWELIALNAASAVANNVKAVVTGVAYTSLADAIEAAPVNGTVTLWADADEIVVSKAVAFNFNNYNGSSIEAGDGYVLNMDEDDIWFITGVATINDTHYTSVAAAVEAAQQGVAIVLWADATAATVNKHVYIYTGGWDASAISAGAGYTKVALDENVFSFNSTAAASFAEFLAAEGEASFTLTEDINISEAGSLPVNGTKTLTIPAGRQIIYARQYADANIVVNAGASLKILGSGSFVPAATTYTKTVDGHAVETSATAADHIGWNIIEVKGNLELGVTGDDDNKPHFVASALNYGSCAITIAQNATATFNNAEVLAGCATVAIYGNATMNGGDYISFSNSLNGVNSDWYSYSVRCGANGHLVVNNANIKGAHGGLAVYSGGVADVYNGTIESVHGYNFATETANTGNYYALYLATYGVVNVYGGKFKVEKPSAHAQSLVMYIGNNDKGTSFGIINLYGGILAEKPYLQKKRATDQDMIFPESVPLSSQWYSNVGEKSTKVPMPVGYDYVEITSGEDYDAGYRWQVVCTNPNTDAIDEDKLSEPTIPWQQATTWATDEVPEEGTIVTIPAGATVVVSNAAADIEAGGKEAVADQIFINQGASLTVQEGTTLSVGDGGMNIANGGSVTVEPGAVVKIGEAGVITSEEEALVLESNEDAQAILLYNPAVAENTQPKATVKLTTKSKQLSKAPWIYTYQRFAIPVKEAMIPANDFAAKVEAGTDEVFAADAARVNGEFQSYVYYWDGANAKWANCLWTDLKPFYGYQLANNSTNGGVTYTFNGNLFGNEDKAFAFEAKGFEYFGNSYTAPIYIKSFLENLKEANPAVEATVWLYNYNNSQYGSVTLDQLSDPAVVAFLGVPTEIKSMDAFVLRLRNANEGAAPVDYSDAIWSNPNVNPSLVSGAPARNMRTSDSKIAAIEVADGNGNSDRVILMENEAYTNGFDNGADAAKFMSKGGIDLYASTNEGELSCVAADDMNKTLISFKSGDATSYTLNFKAMNTDYMLRDNVANTVVAVEEGATYTFNQAANTTVPARFEIIAAAKVPTSIENVETAAKASGIYSITGQFLGNDFSVLSAGVYVVNGVKIVK